MLSNFIIYVCFSNSVCYLESYSGLGFLSNVFEKSFWPCEALFWNLLLCFLTMTTPSPSAPFFSLSDISKKSSCAAYGLLCQGSSCWYYPPLPSGCSAKSASSRSSEKVTLQRNYPYPCKLLVSCQVQGWAQKFRWLMILHLLQRVPAVTYLVTHDVWSSELFCAFRR